MTNHEALVESNRCLFCYDAPCTRACPTHIDVPKFIKKIASGNVTGSARTIFDSNLLGATCSRVCPVEVLCEGACVLNAEHKPIAIGRLQQFAMDHAYRNRAFVKTPLPNGKKVAVIGSGPAGLSCAGELARRGHSVTIFEKRDLPGGLSTYGIITLREPVEIALAEVEMIKSLGVKIETGREANLEELGKTFDAVFLAIGLGSTPKLGIPGEECIVNGLAYIEQSKLRLSEMRPARNVVVIGAGNTAVDCATIAKRLGAERVTMVYRRSENEVTAYAHEIAFVRLEGAELRFFSQPVRVVEGGLECVRTELGAPDASGRRAPVAIPGSEFVIEADQIIKAIGQEKPRIAGVATENGYIKVDANLQTSISGVYAGGDCIRAKGAASTVMAVQDGKIAAMAIHHG